MMDGCGATRVHCIAKLGCCPEPTRRCVSRCRARRAVSQAWSGGGVVPSARVLLASDMVRREAWSAEVMILRQ